LVVAGIFLQAASEVLKKFLILYKKVHQPRFRATLLNVDSIDCRGSFVLVSSGPLLA